MVESHELAKSVVQPHLLGGFTCGHKHAGVLAIDQDYYSKAAPVLDTQIRKAGVPLGKFFNDALNR